MRGTSRVNSKLCCCEKAKSKGTHIGHEASVLAFADGSAGVLLRAPTLCGVSLRIVGVFQTAFYLVGGPGGHARTPAELSHMHMRPTRVSDSERRSWR